jgi:hypothetical protein
MIKGMGIFPNSIVVNVREPLAFKEECRLTDNYQFGTLDLTESQLWLIDGQHRLRMIKELGETNLSYYDYPFIVTILNTPDPYIELLNFYFIHNRQKPITSSDKDKLLDTILTLKGKEKLHELEGTYNLRRTYAFDLVRRLNENPESIFAGKIGYSNNDNKDSIIIEHSKMINAVMPIMNNILFQGLSIQDIADNLVCYWEGIYQVYPEVFCSPEEYVVLSERGLSLFHKLYISIYGSINKGGLICKEKVEELFEKLQKETPQHSDEEFRGRMTDYFWHKKYGPEFVRKMGAKDAIRVLNSLLEKLYVDEEKRLVLTSNPGS